MDTSWIRLPNDHSAYVNGCLKFLDLAKGSLVEGKTRCPCKICKLRYWLTLDEVQGHILFKGFYQKYTTWIWHSNVDVLDHLDKNEHGNTSGGTFVGRDDIRGLLEDSILAKDSYSSREFNNEPSARLCEQNSEDDDEAIESSSSDEYDSENDFDDLDYDNQSKESIGPSNNEEDLKYKRLLEAAKEELYDGCQSFSKLSFLLHLFHIKCMFHWSNESFNKFLELLLEAFPQIREFPSSFYEGKKIINNLGLGYEKIHACPKNCMLYWGEFSEKEECHVCHTSRWKKSKGESGNSNDKDKCRPKRGEAAKVMRYFPLIPRLERVYMSSKIYLVST